MTTLTLETSLSPVLSAKDVAKLFGVDVSTIYDWANRLYLPSKKIGGRRFFLRSDVLSLFSQVPGPKVKG